MQFKLGQLVTVITEDNGSLDGYVSTIVEGNHWLIVTPLSEDVQRAFPKGYKLGSAHWPFRLQRLQP